MVIIICTNLIKTVARILTLLLKDKAASAEIVLCITTPKMAPRTIAISICEVKFDVIDFSCVSVELIGLRWVIWVWLIIISNSSIEATFY
jgi:hypothetical protein